MKCEWEFSKAGQRLEGPLGRGISMSKGEQWPVILWDFF